MIKMEWAPKCIGCKEVVDGLSNGGDEIANDQTSTPEQGDFTVCLICATLMKFDKELNLVAVGKSEIEALPTYCREQIDMTLRVAVRNIAAREKRIIERNQLQ